MQQQRHGVSQACVDFTLQIGGRTRVDGRLQKGTMRGGLGSGGVDSTGAFHLLKPHVGAMLVLIRA